MCFTPELSFSFFSAGALLTYLTYKDPVLRKSYAPLLFGFYSAMELLQTIQYSVVNKCESPVNVVSTEIAYLLVILQPLMWNTIFYLRSGDVKSQSIFKLAAILCAVWIAMNVYHRFAYSPETAQDKCGIFNNDKTCTYRDSPTSHLYWKWRTAFKPDMTANYFMYLALWFVPALLASETRLAGLVLMAGAGIGYYLTKLYGKQDAEFASIWCYISVPILLLGYSDMLLGTKLL